MPALWLFSPKLLAREPWQPELPVWSRPSLLAWALFLPQSLLEFSSMSQESSLKRRALTSSLPWWTRSWELPSSRQAWERSFLQPSSWHLPASRLLASQQLALRLLPLQGALSQQAWTQQRQQYFSSPEPRCEVWSFSEQRQRRHQQSSRSSSRHASAQPVEHRWSGADAASDLWESLVFFSQSPRVCLTGRSRRGLSLIPKLGARRVPGQTSDGCGGPPPPPGGKCWPGASPDVRPPDLPPGSP